MALNPAGLVLRMIGQENAFRMELERCLRIRSRLSSCTRCKDACPEGALTIGKEGFSVNERCTLCGLCMAACPTGAIAVAVKQALGAGFLTLNDKRRLFAYPAFYRKDGRVWIADDLCNGCGACLQVCGRKAIKVKVEE